MKNLQALAAVGVFGFMAGCASASFGGSNGTPASPVASSAAPGADATKAATPPASPSPGTDTSGVGGSTPCAAGSVTLQYTSAEQDCIVNQGKTWDFETNQCGSMKSAAFTCTWANVVAQLQSHGLLDSTIQNASTDGSKLVSCGQSQDTNRIAVQFISAPNATSVSCSGTPSTAVSVTTGCYVDNPNGPAPTIPAGPSPAYDAYVYSCMNQL